MKLFGSTKSGARLAKNRDAYVYPAGSHNSPSVAAARKKNKPYPALAVFLSIVLFLECTYFFLVYTDMPFVKHWRVEYISTAMDTMTKHWLATLIIPYDVIDEEYAAPRRRGMEKQDGVESNENWAAEIKENNPNMTDPESVSISVSTKDPNQITEDNFFEWFHEVDPTSFRQYLADHPEVLDDGWENLCINEAGLDDSGTSIETVHGDKILAIDVPNKVLIIRVTGSKYGVTYVGALAIGKDPAQLYVRPSSKLWTIGETVAEIASANNGVLAMTGSAFIDPDGNGNGGELAGYAMYDGVGDGYGHMGRGYKRLEIHEDNVMYITDAPTAVGEGTTDAVEFGPALIVDGEILVDANCGYTGIQPRACIGQSDQLGVMMLIIEGRQSHSLGTDVIECADILKKYGCMQAMNLDGGTSAIMWYDGETITKCSNQRLPDGRPLPTAFVYERID